MARRKEERGRSCWPGVGDLHQSRAYTGHGASYSSTVVCETIIFRVKLSQSRGARATRHLTPLFPMIISTQPRVTALTVILDVHRTIHVSPTAQLRSTPCIPYLMPYSPIC